MRLSLILTALLSTGLFFSCDTRTAILSSAPLVSVYAPHAGMTPSVPTGAELCPTVTLPTSLGAYQSDSVTKGSLTFTLRTRPAGEYWEMELSVNAAGWVAVGFDPTMWMADADIKIGYVTDSHTGMRDDFGVGPTSHNSDQSHGGKSHLFNLSGSETSGVTTLRFVVPQTGAESFDKSLTPGSSHNVIFAAASSDDFTTKHITTAGLSLKLPTSP